MGTGEVCSYRLRRIGPTPTCSNVADILILKNGITRFGRATNNDFYLDSTRLKNFISRLHAEIHCIKTDLGDLEFHLYDKGLNGTFVNDRKMNGPHLLGEGDIVTFGHTNGFKLKPGDYAKQPNSEFQFVFERVLEKEEESSVRTGDIPGVKSNSPRNDTANTNGYQSNQLPGNRPDTCASSKLSLQKEKTELYSGASSPTRRRNLSTQGNKTSVKSSSESVESDTDVRKGNQKTYRRNSPVKNTDHHQNGTGFQSLSDLDDNDSGSRNINIVRTSPKGKKRKSSDSPERARQKGNKSAKMNNLERLSEDLDDLPSLGSNSDRSGDEEDTLTPDPFAFTAEDSGLDVSKKKKRGPTKKKVKQTPAKDLKETKTPKKKKMTKGPVTKPPPKPAEPKKKKGKGGKRGRRKKSDSSDDDDDDSNDEDDVMQQYDDLEDGVEWYEEEACSAPDCKRPRHKRVAWVQCDDCDQWYHTDCVGCRYEHVKDSNIKFSCGCR